MSDDFEDHILSILERWWAAKHTERHGIVTSYDPDKYLAKVAIQPGGQETGWLPIETGHIGETYGIVIGLQPGKGGVNSKGQGGQAGPMKDNQGDQVIVRFHEGDFESGKVVQRVHSDTDHPPKAEPGEMIFYTKFQKSGGPTPDSGDGGQGGDGQQIKFLKDGSISWTDGNGATTVHDGKGNITITSTNNTITQTAKGDITITSTSGDIAVNANGGAVTVTAGIINTVGDTHLGSQGGKPAAQLGTIDTAGAVDIANLAGLVTVT
jgi:phage baseplate assembly protein gpV